MPFHDSTSLSTTNISTAASQTPSFATGPVGTKGWPTDVSAISTPPQTGPVTDNAFVQSSHVPSAQGDQHTQPSQFDSEGNPTLGENAEAGESRAAIAAVCAGLGVFFVGGVVVAECAGRSDTRTEDPEAKSKGSDVSKKSLRDQMLFTRKKFA